MVGVVACVVPLRTSVVVDFSNQNWYLEGCKTVFILERLFCITGADESMKIGKIEASASNKLVGVVACVPLRTSGTKMCCVLCGCPTHAFC